jgi:hypothetical protein
MNTPSSLGRKNVVYDRSGAAAIGRRVGHTDVSRSLSPTDTRPCFAIHPHLLLTFARVLYQEDHTISHEMPTANEHA